MPTVDWTDPCAKALALRTAYYALLSGQAESLIRNSTPEGDQEVRYARADIDRLKAELDDAEVACAVATNQPVPSRARRFAIMAGGRRHNPRGLRGRDGEGC